MAELAVPVHFLDENLKFICQYTGVNDVPKIKQHVLKIWYDMKSKVHIYGCIEWFLFLRPRIVEHPAYSLVLEALRDGGKKPRMLDAGCAFGTDTRKLVLDGLPSEDVVALDVHDSYWEFGKELYMDRDTLKTPFIAGNIVNDAFFSLTDSTTPGHQLLTGFNFVYIGAVLHVLAKEDVEVFLVKIFSMLAPGGHLFGTACGAPEPCEWWDVPDGSGRKRWLHSKASLTALFGQLGYMDVRVVDASMPSEFDEVVQRGDTGPATCWYELQARHP